MQKTTNACTDVGEKFKSSEHDFFSVCKKANDASAEFQCPKEPHQITAGECGEGPGHGKREGGGQRKHEGGGQRKHEGKQHKRKPDVSSDDSVDSSSDGSTDDNADTKKKSKDYSQYYKKPDGSNADTDTGDSKKAGSSGKDQEPEESSAGSAALAISGVILGICVIGCVVIFAIRRYNSAKYEKSGGTSAMGHVYGYGGKSKGDSYRDSEDDDDEEISLKFADHPSDGSSAEDEN